MEIKRRNCESLSNRDRRKNPGKEGTMRQVTRMHRTLVVLAVGLLALAAPLVAYAGNGGPNGG
jgi:hypothetical protein